jgi:hypothetical protein
MRGVSGRKLALISLTLIAIASTASAAIVERGNVRFTVSGQIMPFELPRNHLAPVAMFISGHVGTVDGSLPPQLQKMVVMVNRHGLLRPRGLPTCTIAQIQPGSTDHALANCGNALVGSGRFWASVVFSDQRPYPTRGRLLVFNGRRSGSPVLLVHIYSSEPFNTSFVISFGIKRIQKGQFGTQLSATFPPALGSWGFVDRIKLTLRRKFTDAGRQRSYFNASCPAPEAAGVASFTLARTSFFFGEKEPLSIDIVKRCSVKR